MHDQTALYDEELAEIAKLIDEGAAVTGVELGWEPARGIANYLMATGVRAPGREPVLNISVKCTSSPEEIAETVKRELALSGRLPVSPLEDSTS